ncbi:MAG: class I SAM-dependent methyltransferase [Candidatus Contendobacter sp.]|jgi:16S rRNA (guanine1516-N2)-methyltransferase|nr:class I SAM-dependent methyltransferase [Gammaproteobacteria bacterium]MCC8993595.1 class I SAM-dependent methyltransferase [Candidatus Contendobacter sp.]
MPDSPAPPPFIAIAAADPLLAAELQLPLLTDPSIPGFTHLLVLTNDRLELRELGPDAPGPVYVDFLSGTAAHRRRFGGGRNQPLARAVGLKGNASPSVIDATAGLSRDAFVLAGLGCTVRLVERSPIIAALLRDGLRRAMQDPVIGPLVNERLSLHLADSRDFLQWLDKTQRPEVIYLDPMYPHRRKTALVGKEMRLLRQVAGTDPDASELLEAALTCALRRVVVKRPRLAPTLIGPSPTLHIIAPNTRFDVYLRQRG